MLALEFKQCKSNISIFFFIDKNLRVYYKLLSVSMMFTLNLPLLFIDESKKTHNKMGIVIVYWAKMLGAVHT